MDVTKVPPTTDPVSLAAGTAPSANPASQSARAVNVGTASTASNPPPTPVEALIDRVDIHPLDVAAALQILIAEVREAVAQELSSAAPDVATILLGAAAPSPPAPLSGLPEPELPGVPPSMPPGLPPQGTDPNPEAGPEAGAGVGLLWPPVPSGLSLLSSPTQASPVLMRLFLQAVPGATRDPAIWTATVTRLEVALQSALERAVLAVEQWRNVPEVVVDAARETRSVVLSQLSDEPPGPLWLRPEWLWLSPQMERFRRRRRLARRGLTDPDVWLRSENYPLDDTRVERKDQP